MTAKMSELTERRKADRAVMAKQVAALADGHGIAASITTVSWRPRGLQVDLAGPHTLALSVVFDGSSPQVEPDTYVLSWHMRPWADEGKGWQLQPGVFGAGVSPYGGDKATDTARGFAQLYYLLQRRCAAIADGSAFVPAGKLAPPDLPECVLLRQMTQEHLTRPPRSG